MANDLVSSKRKDNMIMDQLSKMISPTEQIKTVKSRVVVETDSKIHTVWHTQRPTQTAMFVQSKDKK